MKRKVRLLTAFGKTQQISEWSKELGIPYNTIWGRLMLKGMTPEESLELTTCFSYSSDDKKDNRKKEKQYYYEGKMWTCLELSNAFGINRNTLHSRLNRGKMSVEDAIKITRDKINVTEIKWHNRIDEGVESYHFIIHQRTGDLLRYFRQCRMLDYRMVGKIYKEFKAAGERSHLQVA